MMSIGKVIKLSPQLEPILAISAKADVFGKSRILVVVSQLMPMIEH